MNPLGPCKFYEIESANPLAEEVKRELFDRIQSPQSTYQKGRISRLMKRHSISSFGHKHITAGSSYFVLYRAQEFDNRLEIRMIKTGMAAFEITKVFLRLPFGLSFFPL